MKSVTALRLTKSGCSSFICKRFYSSANNNNNVTSYSAKHLVGLKNQDSSQPVSRQEADEEAQQWISALKELRKDFTSNGEETYKPSKALSPSGVGEIDIFQQAIDEKASQKFQPSAEQQAQILKVKGAPIPSKQDSTINYLTNLIMRDGKKARAEKLMSQALYLVHLKKRTDPVQLLKDIIEKMAPLVKLKRYTDGGARAELVPIPLSEKQRIRQAWTWILESANKRPSKDFSVRLAEEIISAANEKSPGFEKRTQQHKVAIVNRSFIKLLTKKR